MIQEDALYFKMEEKNLQLKSKNNIENEEGLLITLMS